MAICVIYHVTVIVKAVGALETAVVSLVRMASMVVHVMATVVQLVLIANCATAKIPIH